MHTEEVVYQTGDTELRGYLCYCEGVTTKRPAVLVSHAWRGLDDFARFKAESLARLGYVAFAVDNYGDGRTAASDEEAGRLMMPLFLDRLLLQSRLKAAFQKLSEYPLVDAKRIGAIGFCFGGLCVLELLRSGVPVRGVVSFHGVLGNKMGDKQAKTVPIANHINGSALILHGHDDPLVSNEDISALTKELTQAKIDWQFMHYGHTSHAFTNPEAANAASGMLYNEAAARRSWLAMINFFNEIFQFYG